MFNLWLLVYTCHQIWLQTILSCFCFNYNISSLYWAMVFVPKAQRKFWPNAKVLPRTYKMVPIRAIPSSIFIHYYVRMQIAKWNHNTNTGRATFVFHDRSGFVFVQHCIGDIKFQDVCLLWMNWIFWPTLHNTKNTDNIWILKNQLLKVNKISHKKWGE